MKVIKSDGRYNYHKDGFTTILQFNMKVRPQRDEFFRLQTAVKELYGDPRFIVGEGTTTRWKSNENYRIQMMSDRKNRRIYLRSEQEVTLLMLRAA